MFMRYVSILIAIGLATASQCHAQKASVHCDSKAGEMSIRYLPSVEALPSAPGVRVVDFSALVLHEPCPATGPCMITSLKKRSMSCKLSGSTFQATFTPTPGNANLAGRCGGAIAGKVEIHRNGKPYLPTTELEPGLCGASEQPAIDTILVRVGAERAQLVRQALQ
ncbi:hypothetical protein [Pelomonas sp. SE-A7]|uniref:hypothetical protein n=1 Tax=Pelomonas sp. SE-A7 TaxID=3054953 RepID=UPI00259D0CF4|nr:hypothetical protein [Pelomonas sp. SE-A7]MDM4766567.1 hypothetical protein [Pelomonas sp. SE-A7]